jgi:uncharacterized protein (DUF58 family)
MLSPTPKSLWITFWLVVPALTLAGIDAAAMPFAAVWLLALVFIAMLDARRLSKTLRQIEVLAKTPVAAYKDKLSSISLAVHLPKEIGETQFALSLPPSFWAAEAVLAAKESAKLSFAFTPGSRGEFALENVFISAASAWGLWRMRVQRTLDLTVQVFPDLSKDPASRKLFAVFQAGQRVLRIIGRGREVERLREYAPGDSFEEVYWKATARRGTPISKVFQVERTQDVYAIVDGSRLGSRNQALEHFVTASLLLAIAAERNSDNFGLLTFNDRVQRFVRGSHGKGHFQRCRKAIFDLQPSPASPDFSELFSFINLRIRKRALLFFLTDLSDPLLAETFLRDAALIARRHVVMVNQIADAADRPLFSGSLPADDSEIQSRLAGHLQWAKLRELERALSHLGIHMQLLKAEAVGGELVSQYLTIKQRQLL